MKQDHEFLMEAETYADIHSSEEKKVGCLITTISSAVCNFSFKALGTNVVKDGKVVHAEKAACQSISSLVRLLEIRKLNFRIEAYVTHPPCADCMSRMLKIGVKRVVILRENVQHWLRPESKWTDAIIGAGKLAMVAGIEYDVYCYNRDEIMNWDDYLIRGFV